MKYVNVSRCLKSVMRCSVVDWYVDEDGEVENNLPQGEGGDADYLYY